MTFLDTVQVVCNIADCECKRSQFTINKGLVSQTGLRLSQD